MYTKSQLLKRAEELRNKDDLETAGMLEHLAQLKFSYIPQLLKKMEDIGFTWSTEHKFPHFAKSNKPCTHDNK